MFRLLTIVAVVVAALAVSAAPASAAGRVGGKMHYDDVSRRDHHRQEPAQAARSRD